MDIIKVLANEKRRLILKILTNKDMHISAIAKELKISVPVTLKHINILEEESLVDKNPIGKAIIIKIKPGTIKILKKLEELFEQAEEISIEKGTALYDVLKNMKSIVIKKHKYYNHHFIKEIDGFEGDYIFRVNGKLPKEGIDTFIIEDDSIIEFQKLTPVLGKRLNIKVKNNN